MLRQEEIQSIKSYVNLKKEIGETNKIIKGYKVVKDELEKKIIRFMLENDMDEVLINKTKKIKVNKKEKYEPVNKKFIEKKCWEYCNGDLRKSEEIIKFIYDKECREKVVKQRLKNQKNKKK